MLKCVEEGNLNYKPEMNRLAVSGKLGEISNRDSLRKIKNAVIIFTAHCANSAIRGGLSSDVAYSLSDRYIQSIEASETIEQIAILNETMVTDYVRRVHNLKNAMGNMSPQIHDCCDLISMNPEKTYDIHMFAVKYGYSDYYFSTKFKKETGQTFRDFLMEKKVERACELLTRGTMDIQEISDSLGFATHSLFGQEFKKRMGCTPSTYRQERGIGNEKD